MKAYIFTIISISIISGILTSLLSNNKLKKYVNFVSGLICTITLLAPITAIATNAYKISENITGFVNKLDVQNSIEKSNQIIISEGTEQISQGIKNAIVNKFSLSEKHLKIEIIIDDKNIDALIIKEVIIILTGEATWCDEKDIKDYIENLIGTKVTVMKQ